MSKQDNPDDPNAHRFANMSYINYLNKQQKMIERGHNYGDDEEDEDTPSEEESNLSDTKNPAIKKGQGKDSSQ
jgi:hypothetical protein